MQACELPLCLLLWPSFLVFALTLGHGTAEIQATGAARKPSNGSGVPDAGTSASFRLAEVGGPMVRGASKWGRRGVMLDFMDRDDQEMVKFPRRAVETAAANRRTPGGSDRGGDPGALGGADGAIERVTGGQPRRSAEGREAGRRLMAPACSGAIGRVWRTAGSRDP